MSRPRDNSGSLDRQKRLQNQMVASALEGKLNTDLLRMKKEHVQQQALIENLRGELDEKERKYIKMTTENKLLFDKLKAGSKQFENFDAIVQKRVNEALEGERKELEDLRVQKSRYEEKVKILQKALDDAKNQNDQLQMRNIDLENSLMLYTRQGSGDTDTLLSKMREDCFAKEKKIDMLLHDHNTLSNQMAEYLQENAYLRQLSNVPANFGMKREHVKLQDQKTADDFKKLIKVLQDDNFHLEEERAKLKHALRVMSIQDMYNIDERSADREQKFKTILEERLKRMSYDELQKVDDFIVRLLNGNEGNEGIRIERLTAENRMLKNNTNTADPIDFQKLKDALKETNKGADNSGLLQQLIDQNDTLRLQIERLMDKIPTQAIGQQSIGVVDPLARYNGGRSDFNPPQPIHPTVPGDEYQGGYSRKFGSQLSVHNENGHEGQKFLEVAFLQLQLQELLEINKRKDEGMKDQSVTIDDLQRKIKKQLLTQDALYKDYCKIKKSFEKREKNYSDSARLKDDEIMKLGIQNKTIQRTLDALAGPESGGDLTRQRYLQLTQEHCLLEEKFMIVSRKYNVLEEQERMIRRQYHDKDEQMGEKDIFVQQRINDLRKWKEMAILQLNMLFNKLKNATPTADYQILRDEFDLANAKLQEQAKINAKHVSDLVRVRAHDRTLQELKQKSQDWEEKQFEYQSSIDVLTKRLEVLDPSFRQENQIFSEIATRINDAKKSLKEAFKIFDANGDGTMDKKEFKEALSIVGIVNLSPDQFNCAWNSLDTDNSGTITVQELIKKLEYFGVRNLSGTDIILSQIITASNLSGVKNMNDLFDMFDREGSGSIDRNDFLEIFKNLGVRVKREDLDRFCDVWWSDSKQGIDYQQFLRMFKRFRLNETEKNSQKDRKTKVFSEKTIRLKKTAFDQIQKQLSERNSSIKDLFRKVDRDSSLAIQKEELYTMLSQMGFRQIDERASNEIFDSIDIDSSGSVSIAEFTSEFMQIIKTPLEILIQDCKQQEMINKQAQQYNSRQPGELEKQNLETRVEILLSKVKQQELKMRNYDRTLFHADEQRKIADQQNIELEANWNQKNKEIHEIKAKCIMLEKEMKGMIRREDGESLKTTNEKMQTELVEVRAAMLSYKNMTQVFADQAKNIKLMHERKKDEHENLLAAMREMQAENSSKERLGQLYSIIMLSRWQEAATNKKYDQVISENKNLRQQLLEGDVKMSQVETKNFDIMNENGAKIDELRQMAARMNKDNQQYMIKSSVDYFNKLIEQLSERNSELEEKIFKIYEDSEQEKIALDAANAKLDTYQTFNLEELKKTSPQEIYVRMIDLANNFQEISLKEKRASRQVTEQQARIEYLQNLFKGKNSALQELEQKNATFESEMIKMREDFLKRDNERAQKHFSRIRELAPATVPSNFNNIRVPYDVGAEPNIADTGFSGGQRGVDNVGFSRGVENNDMLKRLQDQITKLCHTLQIKEAQIKQYENWQGIDKTLTADEVLKDAISNHQARTTVAHDKEQKEMSDAAYQTIKTLQEMLAFKSESLNQKDQQLEKLRDDMIERRTKDAERIVKLQSDLHAAQQKLNEIMHREVGLHDDSRKRPQTDKWDRKAEKHYEDLIREKDRLISDLQSRLSGKAQERGAFGASSSKQQGEIDGLKSEIKRLNTELSNNASDKRRFQQLQVRRDEQDKFIKNLTAGLDDLKEKLTRAEMNNLSNKKDGSNQIEDLQHRKKIAEEKEAKDKLGLLQSKVAELTKDKQNLAVEKSRCETKIAEIGKEKEGMVRNNVDLQRAKEEQKAEIDRLKKQVADYQKKDSGQSNLVAFEELKKKVGELEQENKILQASQKTVVAFDREREVFAYIGDAIPLGLHQNDLKIEKILQTMYSHVQQNKAISSLRSICQSYDINRTGELNQQEFTEACKQIGVTLLRPEVQLIEKACSTLNTSGLICYDPIVRYLQGIPTFKFMDQNPTLKIAELVLRRDATKVDLRSWLVDKNSQATEISHAELMKRLKLMCSNPDELNLSQEELDKTWTFFNNGNPSTQAQANVVIAKIVDEVYQVLRALVINNIYQYMQRHDLYFWKLVAKVNTGKEEYLTTPQMKTLLLEVGYSVMGDNVFDDFMKVLEIKNGKFTYSALMKYFGNAFVTVRKMPDAMTAQQPSLAAQSNSLHQQRSEKVSKIARKVLIGWPRIKVDLNNDEGIISREELQQRIEKKVSNIDASELQELVRWADFCQRGQICTSVFIQRIVDQAQEAPADTLLRELFRKSNLQGVNLLESLKKFDRARANVLEKRNFKQAFNSVPLGYSDAEIEKLFEYCQKNGAVNIVDFTSKVKEIGKTETLPQELRKAEAPSSFSNKSAASEPPHELEKKYAKCLSELKDQIESQNKDLLQAKKEIERKDYANRKLEEENQGLQSRLCAQPDASSNVDHLRSELQGARDEAQRLNEEIHHVNEVNLTLRKKLNVDLKAELGKLTTEKEQAEHKLKIALERLKQKTDEHNMLMGKPMDAVTRREEREEARQRAIDIMDQDIGKLEQANQELQDKLFVAEERLLDLKFEKETFDLQYARMQKRISELEKYKMKAAAMSDDLRRQYEDEMEEIKDQTDKLRGDALAQKPGENVKLRRKTTKTAQELEATVEQLKRVIEKQKVELEHLSQQKVGLEGQVQKKVNEPALLNKIKTLETQLQHYSMQELAMEQKDQTIKKLVYANTTLRSDLQREIDRFTQLEAKFREVLIKYNIKVKENSRNQQTLFETATGAQISNFESFIDDKGEFGKRKEDGNDSDGSLNDYNRSPPKKRV